jgi:hypothetical protein
VQRAVDRLNNLASGINNFSRNTSFNYTINVAIKHVNGQFIYYNFHNSRNRS